jgi:hypothetical protein
VPACVDVFGRHRPRAGHRAATIGIERRAEAEIRAIQRQSSRRDRARRRQVDRVHRTCVEIDRPSHRRAGSATAIVAPISQEDP